MAANGLRSKTVATAVAMTLMVSSTLLLSCHASVSSQDSLDTENLSYHYKESINGTTCETAQSFASKEEYCAGLRDFKLNKGCALTERRATFEDECGSEFSETNVVDVVVDVISAGPIPSPPPGPSPDPVSPSSGESDIRTQLVRDLASQGVALRVLGPRLHLEMDDDSFQPLLEGFMEILLKSESELLARKTAFERIEIADFAQYSPSRRVLTLPVQFTAEQLSRELKILDRRLRLEADLGLHFEFDLECDGASAVPFASIENKLNRLANHPDLKFLGPLIKTIEFEGRPSAPKPEDFQSAVDQLQRFLPELSRLAQTGRLRRIIVRPELPTPIYRPAIQELGFSGRHENYNATAAALGSLERVDSLGKALRLSIEFTPTTNSMGKDGAFALDTLYMNLLSWLEEKRTSLARKSTIQMIVIAQSNQTKGTHSEFKSGKLLLSTSSSRAELDVLLKSIR